MRARAQDRLWFRLSVVHFFLSLSVCVHLFLVGFDLRLGGLLLSFETSLRGFGICFRLFLGLGSCVIDRFFLLVQGVLGDFAIFFDEFVIAIVAAHQSERTSGQKYC